MPESRHAYKIISSRPHFGDLWVTGKDGDGIAHIYTKNRSVSLCGKKWQNLVRSVSLKMPERHCGTCASELEQGGG